MLNIYNIFPKINTIFEIFIKYFHFKNFPLKYSENNEDFNVQEIKCSRNQMFKKSNV